MARYIPKLPPLDPCPVERVVALIGGRWKIRILYRLALTDAAMAELRRFLPRARPQVLTAQLRELEADDLARRLPPLPGQAWGSYHLTERGRALLESLAHAADWGRAELGGWEPPTIAAMVRPIEPDGSHDERPVRRRVAESAACRPQPGAEGRPHLRHRTD